jgi:glycosyltransferase involved in cell wall biosynthesis
VSAAPLVTIGVPVYNSELYLATSLDSLLAQTYRDFVLIICDNASTDGTAELCQRYVARDPRVRYYRNPVNIGMNGNFNRVFELTQTKYIKWSTADDFWAPEMLADAVAILEADESIVVCYPRVVIVDAEGKERDRFEDELHLMQDDPVERFLTLIRKIKLANHHLGLLRTSAIRRTRLFGKHTGADIGFLAEMALYGKYCEVPKYQYFRRFHSESSSWKRADQDQQARRFHAANVRRIAFNDWRFHWAFTSAVLRSPLGAAAKLKVLGILAKRMYWDREALFADLRRAVPAKPGITSG